jgi:Tat protein secretion system quality control protein TatD with DNase activity
LTKNKDNKKGALCQQHNAAPYYTLYKAHFASINCMVADVRLTDREELKEALWNNACSLFRWEEL